MTLTLLKAKLHRIRVTEACLDYEGSLTLDPDDMEAVGIVPYERILCADVENGNRFETYAICGKRGLLPQRCRGPQGQGRRSSDRHGLRADVGRGSEGLGSQGEALHLNP